MAKIIIGLFVVVSQGKLFLSVSIEAIGFLSGFDYLQTTSTTKFVMYIREQKCS